MLDLWNTTKHPGLCNSEIINVSLKGIIIGLLPVNATFVDDKVTPGPQEDPATMRGPEDCEVTPVLLAALCPCLSGDATAYLSDSVSNPNPNMHTQLQ